MAQKTSQMIRLVVALAIAMAAMLAPAAAQQAQQAPQPRQADIAVHSPDVLTEQKAALDALEARVDEIEKGVATHATDDATLANYRVELEDILTEALDIGVAFRPRLLDMNTRQELLGPAPKDGEAAESEIVAAERKELQAEKAQINVVIGRAEDLSVRVKQLITKISNMRRDLFTSQITKRSELGNAISQQVFSDLATETRVLGNRVFAAVRSAVRTKLPELLLTVVVSILTSIVLKYLGNKFFGVVLRRDPTNPKPSYLSRLSVAFWSSLLPALNLAVTLAIALLFLEVGHVFNADMLAFCTSIVGVILVGFIVYRISRGVISPDMPHWRLLRIEPEPGRILIALLTALGVIVGLDSMASTISDRLGSPLSVTIMKSLIAAVISGVLIVAISRVRPFLDGAGRSQAWPSWLRLTLLSIGVGSILASILGYISFAQFVSSQLVVTGALLALGYIGLAASSAISEEGGLARTALGDWLSQEQHFSERRLDQLGVLISVIFNVLIIMLFLPFVLVQWGFRVGDFSAWMNRLATGFKIGEFSFSPLAILTGVVVFAIGYAVTRWFKRWLDGTVMARGGVDAGVRNSIRTVVGYAGMAISALIAVSAAGFDLSSIALVAGGLSLGIGFGLQNIVSNFVSGLILLAERPFKVGDWIEAGAVSGTVKRISVRATEIETFQRQSVTLPNSVLINGAVANWTKNNKLGRIEVPFGVIYASDPRRVQDIALGIAANHPMVLRNPEPSVLFQGFTDVALTFEVRAFLADITHGAAVRNDIRVGLVEAFREHQIMLATTLNPPPPAAEEPKLETADDDKR